MSSHARNWIKVAIQLLVSAGLMAYLARQLNFAEIKPLLVRPGGWAWLLGALALFNASKLVAALRLNIYQRHVDVVLTEAQNLRLYYAGMFLNLFLPGGIGGDGYKIFVLNRQHGVPVKKLVLATLADRVSGLLCLALLLCGLVPMVGLPWGARWVWALAALSACTVVATMFVGHHLLFKFETAVVGKIFLSGLAVQLLQLACITLLLAYVHVQIKDYAPFLAVFLVSSIVAVLPLSIGGIGAREVTFYFCLKALQLEPVHGVVVSSCFFLLTFTSSAIGILFLKSISLRKVKVA